MFRRIFNPPKSHSFFLFGARGTGKTTALKEYFRDQNVLFFDLLDPELEERLSRHPMDLSKQLTLAADNPNIEWVVIDEIQKIPKLLDVIHLEIEKKRFNFALTGSSARKLRRGYANLLAGRAFLKSLFPLTFILNHLLQNDFTLSYLKTKESVEVDLIIERPGQPLAFIEMKSTDNISDKTFTALENLIGDMKIKNNPEIFCFSCDSRSFKQGRVTCLPWDKGLATLGLVEK